MSEFPYNATSLKKLLDGVNPAGSFATSGTFTPTVLSPKISVEGVGTIGLPLHPCMAEVLKEQAEKAPFGRGPATLVDESIRRAWQIDPAKVTVGGVEWEATTSKIVKKACYELGISNENVAKLEIKANLYKVLLYETGGHFTKHKDTVKEDGMFGTLVVQLPSQFGGASSVISHQGQSKTIESASNCESTFQYTAFYGDCEHEILPVTEGYRFCLVFNLVVTKPNSVGVVPTANQMQATVNELLVEAVKWKTSTTGKLGYPLDHEYTLNSFGFGTLKGRDAVVMSVLRNAMDATGARLFDLSLVSFYHKSYYGGYSGEQEYGIENVLLEDSEESPKEASPVWVSDVMYWQKDGFLREIDELPEEQQANLKEAREDGEADIGNENEVWKNHHDAGNEGGGSTTWYRAACLVFRPSSKVDLNSTIASLVDGADVRSSAKSG